MYSVYLKLRYNNWYIAIYYTWMKKLYEYEFILHYAFVSLLHFILIANPIIHNYLCIYDVFVYSSVMLWAPVYNSILSSHGDTPSSSVIWIHSKELLLVVYWKEFLYICDVCACISFLPINPMYSFIPTLCFACCNYSWQVNTAMFSFRDWNFHNFMKFV